MISTQNPAALPDAAALQRLCKALAVLDALNSPEWEYRYYSYNANWGEGEELFEMRDGEGDQMLVLFRPEGCVIDGYADGLAQPDKAQLTRGLPQVFDEFMFGEPVNSIGTTFCLWYMPAHGWQIGLVAADKDDGSEELLYIFDGEPATYATWAEEYYDEDETKQPLDPDAVAAVYRGETLTKAMVQALVGRVADWPQLAAELQEINYPYNFH